MTFNRPASLMLVFIAAKIAVLAGRTIDLGWWSPIAYLWQDAAVVLAFAALEYALGRRQRVIWVLYAAATAYAAINVPVTRAVSTPLTLPMLRAARGALSDSLFYYATWQNALLVVCVAALAMATPILLRRTPRRSLLVVWCLWVAAGPWASARVDTAGLERNAWTALARSVLPRPGYTAAPREWTAEGFDRTNHPGLERFAGIAAGRNVILLSLESTAAQYLGLYGAHPDPMPNLSKLARSSVVFENAYAVYPESIKGLFTVLCSAWPAYDSSAETHGSVPCHGLAEVLREARYRTALFHSGRFAYLGMESVIRNRGFATLEDAGDIGGNRQSSFGIDEPSTVARILSWIDALPQGQRFFVTYLPIAGHHPYESPEPGPFPDREEFGRYRNALFYGDAALGMLIQGLRSRGLEQDTVWVIFGDHGEAFGQHDNYGHTFQVYEENVHVPFLIAAPGQIPNQLRNRQVVSLIDLAPTVLSLAGLTVPQGYQGRSILNPSPRMALFFADYSLGILGVRDGAHKFIYELDSGRSKLFDLERDPTEKNNIAALRPELVQWYTRNLRNWRKAGVLSASSASPR